MPSEMNSESVNAFRERYRRGEIGRRYSGVLHLAFTTLSCLAAIGFCLSLLELVRAWEWLTLPISFLLANFIEYAGNHVPYTLKMAESAVDASRKRPV